MSEVDDLLRSVKFLQIELVLIGRECKDGILRLAMRSAGCSTDLSGNT